MNTAVIYTRVSTAEQADGGTSLGTQEQACRAWCESRGYDVKRLFSDAGESAKTADRPQFIELIAWASKHRPDIAVVWKFDRWARHATDHAVARMALEKHGTRLVSATEAAADDPAGRLLQTILSGIAQFDNEVRAERTRAAMRSIAMRGGWCHKPPIGFLCSHSGPLPILVEDPEKGPVVREMFLGLAAGRRTLHQTCQFAREHDIPESSARSLLRSAVYGGMIRNALTSNRTIEAAFRPLVDRDAWRQAQDAITGKRRDRYVKQRADMPLRGVLHCSECGQILAAGFSRGRNRRYGYYQCKHGHVRARIEVVHASWELLLATAGCDYGDLLAAVRPKLRERIEERQEAARTVERDSQAEIHRLQQRRSRLLDAFLNGALSQDQFTARDEDLRDRLERAGKANQSTFEWGMDVDNMVSRLVQMLADPVALWRGLAVDQQQRFAMAMFGTDIVMDSDGNCRTAASGGLAGVLTFQSAPDCEMAPHSAAGMNLTGLVAAVQAFFRQAA